MARSSTAANSALPAQQKFDIDIAENNDKNQRKVSKTLTPAQLEKYLRFALADVTPKGRWKRMLAVMIWGSPGVGKTDVIRQLAEKRGARLVALHLPQYDPTDVKGIVVRLSDDTIKWMPSSYLPGYVKHSRVFFSDPYDVAFRFPYSENLDFRVTQSGKNITDEFTIDVFDPTNSARISPKTGAKIDFGTSCTVELFERAILFLDEISAADIEVQKAALQLVLDRRVGEYDLPPTCPVVAAGNMEQDGAFTNPMSGPLSNRFNHVKLVHSLTEWISYEINSGRANPETIAFLTNYGSAYLHRYESSELTDGNNGFATPRSWSFLAEQLNAVEDFGNEFSVDDQETLIIGQIGATVGTAFIGFRSVRNKLPDLEAIFRNEDVAIHRDFDLPSQYMIAIMLALKMGKDIYPVEWDSDANGGRGRGTERWDTAREGFFKFITKNLPNDIQYLAVSMMQSKMGVQGSALICEGFKKYATAIMPLQKNVHSSHR
mgnify:CR=1 FL=1